jgi:phage/plasmid-associated DNA primase
MALFGESMKNIFFCLGETDTGKSTIVKALLKSCADLVGTFNAESLSIKKDSSQDEAQQMRWAFLHRYKRMIFSNEMGMNAKLNGNMVKKISSGGDDLVGRRHCGHETNFRPHFISFIFANDIPEIKPYDNAVDNRLRVVPFTKRYVENPKENELQRDDNLEMEMETEEFQQAFISLLIQTYVEYFAYGKMEDPIGMISAKKEWVSQDPNSMNKFLEDFEITNNPEHFVTCKEIRDWNEENKTGISDTKMGRDLKNYATKHKMENVCTKPKKIEGKTVQVWFGIRLSEKGLDI